MIIAQWVLLLLRWWVNQYPRHTHTHVRLATICLTFLVCDFIIQSWMKYKSVYTLSRTVEKCEKGLCHINIDIVRLQMAKTFNLYQTLYTYNHKWLHIVAVVTPWTVWYRVCGWHRHLGCGWRIGETSGKWEESRRGTRISIPYGSNVFVFWQQ